MKRWLIAGLCVSVCALSVWLYSREEANMWPFPKSDAGFQAVFLGNGQVYFGKLAGSFDGGFTLRDIYYLGGGTASDSPSSLVKLGTEYHGPTDTMHIPGAQVLMWEDLRTDGDVAKAIASRENIPSSSPN